MEKTEYHVLEIMNVGYVVIKKDDDGDGWLSSSCLRNFGQHREEAQTFRNDCTKGKISKKRIEKLIDTYTDQPYRYISEVLRKE